MPKEKGALIMIQIKKTSLIAFVSGAVFLVTSFSILAGDYQSHTQIENKNEIKYLNQRSQQPYSSSEQKNSESNSGQSSSQDYDLIAIQNNLLGMDKSSSFYYQLLLLH